jgi:glycosyltransferase involved in cell wall biosynthesis
LFDHHGNTIDNNEAKAILGIKEELVVLSFGLIRKYKGIPFLIEAFNQLPSELQAKTRLLIVGEIWEDGDELRKLIRDSPVNEKITLVNTYVPDDKIHLYFSAANIVVLPYTRASQSGVAHVAMSFGKPIIVSEVGGLKESMATYSGTHFIEPYDIIAIRENIKKNIYDTTFHAAPEQTWEAITKKYVELINSI